MLRRTAESILLALLLAVCLPLLAARSLLARRRRSAPQPQLPSTHQFAFHHALPAYEALIDSTVARCP